MALPADELVISNMGYALISENGLTTQIKFDNTDEEAAFLDNPYQYQLYHYLVTWLASDHVLRGLSVVDVSCGKGGSTHFVKSQFAPQKVVGVDISARQIEMAQSAFEQASVKDLSDDNQSRSQSEEGKFVASRLEVDQSTPLTSQIEFKVWDAEKLEGLAPPGSVDCVLNVESSHQYGSRDAFFEGVHGLLADPEEEKSETLNG